MLVLLNVLNGQRAGQVIIERNGHRQRVSRVTYSRQRETKLTKTGSQFFKMDVRSLEPGRRLRPLLLVMQRGFPFESIRNR